MNNVTAFLQGFVCALLGLGLWALPAAQVEARYASIVIDTHTGTVLHEANADTRNYPASLVKMVTLYMVFEALEDGRLHLDQRLKVSRRATSMPPSRLGLKVGQEIRVKDAILGLSTKSANDVAVVLAEALGGTEVKFARMMTKRARALGMGRSSFRNASGLPDRGQLSTARDMATLAQALLRDFPQYYHYFSVTRFRYHGRSYKNHNRLLKTYPGTDGIKTGYTSASGFNLVASVVRGDRRLVAVVFGGKTARSRNRHMVKLLDRGFAKVASMAELGPSRATTVSIAQADAKADGTINDHAVANEKAVQTSAIDPSTGPYGAQVGAYYRYNRAERAAINAAQQLPELLGKTRVWVPQIKGKKGRIFLARLVGLTKVYAREACRQLKSINIDCLAVKVGEAVNIALN